MSTRIIFNGREYSSSEAMPPEVRKAYEALARLAAGAGGELPGAVRETSRQKIKVQITRSPEGLGLQVGSYSSPGEMPPEVRALYEQAMSAAEGGKSRADFVVKTDKVVNIRVDGAGLPDLTRGPITVQRLPEAGPGFPERGREARTERALLMVLAILVGAGLVVGLAWLIMKLA